MGCVILSAEAGFRAAAGPWWAGFLLAVLALLACCLWIVFPQNSADKLKWWRERRRSGHGPRQR